MKFMSNMAAIILAAGKSTRMNSDLPKVLHLVCGTPMLSYVLRACYDAGIENVKVVVGHRKELVIEAFKDDTRIEWIEQSEQLGTGHAILACEAAFTSFEGNIVIIAGDMPLVRSETIRGLLKAHTKAKATVSLATTELTDPTGYGRIIRDQNGGLLGIVEHNDCTKEQRQIHEVNISYYCFNSQALFDALRRVAPHKTKGEYYITDAVRNIIADGRPSASLPGVIPEDALGINSQEDLALVNRTMEKRITGVQLTH